MTESERNLLAHIALRPNGAIIRDPEDKRLVGRFTMKGYVSDVYEVAGGALTARITSDGRDALRKPFA
jgi:hypothetical protein